MTQNKIAVFKSGDIHEEEGYGLVIRESGFEPLYEPLLKIEYISMTLPFLCDDTPIIFTSAHGVESFVKGQNERHNPVYTVGRNTAESARQAGFTHIFSADGDAAALARVLIRADKEKSLISPIYVRAEKISYDLDSVLRKNDINLYEIIGYRAIQAQNLSLNLLQSLDKEEIKAVMLFSERASSCFVALIERYECQTRLKKVQALCIAPSVLKSVSVLPFETIQIANRPDRHGMMELIKNISIA